MAIIFQTREIDQVIKNVSNFSEISRDQRLHVQSVPGSLAYTQESGSEATCCISYTEMTQKLGTAILREAIMHTVHSQLREVSDLIMQ